MRISSGTKEWALRVMYVIAKGFTYLLMLTAICGLFLGATVVWQMKHMPK